MELKDRTALVTGGGSGIGLGIAVALAAEGCRVAIAGRTRQRLLDAAAGFDTGPPILTRPCDVADRADVERLFAWLSGELGPLDVLVNSAGINVSRRGMAELDPADWDRMIAVNLTGSFNCIHAALPGMRERNSGLIVNISSIAGKRAMKLGGVGYCASKFGLTALGTTVGLEERANGIRVTNIYPGEVSTPILAQRPTPVPPEKKARMLQPEDIAACVLTIARLPSRALVPELVITPLYQEYA
ncbi:MAG: SDR family oxidoreductase [Planctomycetota bacterium]|jgi:NAD(P)-dependent dehydrogenase (short-subunit alcohol dehydrogenase family)